MYSNGQINLKDFLIKLCLTSRSTLMLEYTTSSKYFASWVQELCVKHKCLGFAMQVRERVLCKWYSSSTWVWVPSMSTTTLIYRYFWGIVFAVVVIPCKDIFASWLILLNVCVTRHVAFCLARLNEMPLSILLIVLYNAPLCFFSPG